VGHNGCMPTQTSAPRRDEPKRQGHSKAGGDYACERWADSAADIHANVVGVKCMGSVPHRRADGDAHFHHPPDRASGLRLGWLIKAGEACGSEDIGGSGCSVGDELWA
jgi:hypothetical protein